MTNKLILDWHQIEKYCYSLSIDILKSGFMPDYIVGITRGGLTPAVMLSHMLNVPMYALHVSLRDGGDSETNCWMSEDAFGYVPDEKRDLIKSRWDSQFQKNILVVDDINDSGDTIAWIKKDWQSTCLPNEDSWKKVWGNNVRFATLVNNLTSNELIDYTSLEINKTEKDVWIVFPWERS